CRGRKRNSAPEPYRVLRTGLQHSFVKFCPSVLAKSRHPAYRRVSTQIVRNLSQQIPTPCGRRLQYREPPCHSRPYTRLVLETKHRILCPQSGQFGQLFGSCFHRSETWSS